MNSPLAVRGDWQASPARPAADGPDRQFERALVAWHLGDWQALVQLDLETVALSASRARIALFMAAAFLQCDRPADAARLLQQAGDWGCDPAAIAEVFVAGAHHNLGRAALLLGQPQQEQEHLARATALGWQGAPQVALAQARAQVNRLELQGTAATAAVSALPAPDPRRGGVAAGLGGPSTARLEAWLALQHMMQGAVLLPPSHEWPLQPEAALWLLRELPASGAVRIVEFGGGPSTLLLAAQVARLQARGGEAPVLATLEPDDAQWAQTASELARSPWHGAASLVRVRGNGDAALRSGLAEMPGPAGPALAVLHRADWPASTAWPALRAGLGGARLDLFLHGADADARADAWARQAAEEGAQVHRRSGADGQAVLLTREWNDGRGR